MSSDKRWRELAKVLVDHSTEVGRDERVLIIMREAEAYPLTAATYDRVIERGGLPQVLFHGAALERSLMLKGEHKQVDWVPELYATAMEWADVCIDLRGAPNLYEFSGIETERISAHRRAEGRISAMRTRQTRWTVCRIPNALFAQQAHQPESEMMETFFSSCLIDWKEESRRLEKLKEKYDGTREIRILSDDTDLRFSTEGRIFVIDDGHINMPGGEVFSAPVEDSVEGHVAFADPGVFAGVLMEGIRLVFSKGKVTKATAGTNEEFLNQVIAMDDGAQRVGEFGIGTNLMLTSFSNDIFFDEKIAGTVHIALGRSYAECGGKNDSSLHWDIVKDLREGGTVYFDGTPLVENGELK